MSRHPSTDPVARDRSLLASTQGKGRIATLGAFVKLSGNEEPYIIDRTALDLFFL